MKRNKFLMIIVAGMILFACQEEGRLDSIDDSAPAPAQITVVGEPESFPGGAVIQIAVPDDKNLLSVKAVYERNGQTCATEISRYTNRLTVEGYGQAGTHEVEIYSVGRNEKLSPPVKVRVTVLTPPVRTVTKDLEASFGGVNVNFANNDLRAALAYVVIADIGNSGTWTHVQTFYAEGERGAFKIRGLNSSETKFALYVRDRWNNVSDTITKSLAPLFEEELPVGTWMNAKLPTDSWEAAENNNWYYQIENLWNGPAGLPQFWTDWKWDGQYFNSTSLGYVFPQWFTIALGYKASISRIHIWPSFKSTDDDYNSVNVREFELWGSDNPPADGSWNNWYFLGHWEVFKPSGYGAGGDRGAVTDEDSDYFRNNQDYDVVPSEENFNPYQSVTHIRFKTIETFVHKTGTPNTQIGIGEIRLYGAQVN
jgi:hypothetical protein